MPNGNGPYAHLLDLAHSGHVHPISSITMFHKPDTNVTLGLVAIVDGLKGTPFVFVGHGSWFTPYRGAILFMANRSFDGDLTTLLQDRCRSNGYLGEAKRLVDAGAGAGRRSRERKNVESCSRTWSAPNAVAIGDQPEEKLGFARQVISKYRYVFFLSVDIAKSICFRRYCVPDRVAVI